MTFSIAVKSERENKCHFRIDIVGVSGIAKGVCFYVMSDNSTTKDLDIKRTLKVKSFKVNIPLSLTGLFSLLTSMIL